jgi:hypothetical protein
MNRAQKFKEKNDSLWAETMDYIEELLEALYDTDLSDQDIQAYAILDDIEAGHVGVFYITKVDKEKVLYGTLDDDEEEVPFEMMTNEALIQLAEDLEEYVDQYVKWD